MGGDVDANMAIIADMDANVANDVNDDVACHTDVEFMWTMTWQMMTCIVI